jgi:hypothetical protein
VDDASADGTADLVRDVARRDPAVELLSRPGKLGLASAYQLALRRVTSWSAPATSPGAASTTGARGGACSRARATCKRGS